MKIALREWSRKMKNKKGFTIVELLVTITVLAGFLAMSLSIGRSSLQRAKFTDAFNTFVADFYNARQLASVENKYVAILFDEFGRSYTIRIQAKYGVNLASEDSYIDYKTVRPLNGEAFFDVKVGGNFAFNPMGAVRSYHVNVDMNTSSCEIEFFKKHEATGTVDFKKTIWIYPSGGLKIGN